MKPIPATLGASNLLCFRLGSGWLDNRFDRNKNSPEVNPGCFRELLLRNARQATKIGSVLKLLACSSIPQASEVVQDPDAQKSSKSVPLVNRPEIPESWQKISDFVLAW